MRKSKFQIDRRSIIEEAYNRCMTEMYAKAQPSADYNELITRKNAGEIVDTNIDPIYKRYYLSQEEFVYIRDKYIQAYNLTAHWHDDVDTVIDYLKNGGLTVVYKKDSSGNPYKTSENTPKLKDVIGEKHEGDVMRLINLCKNFYRFDGEESNFSCTLSLGCSPTSNKESVIQYWKEHGQEIIIEDRDPDTFWYRDEYGDDWEEIYEDEKEEYRMYKEEKKLLE